MSVGQHRSLICALIAVGVVTAAAVLAVCCICRLRHCIEVAEVPACADVAALEARPRDVATEASLLFDNAAKNEIANKLLSGTNIPDGLVASLCRMSSDRTYDDCWRDYCIQFLCVALSRSDNALSDEDRWLAVATLREAVRETTSPSAGTALLSFRSAAESSNDNGLRQEVATHALRIASSDGSSDSARTTALLVLEQMNPPQAQRVASQIVVARRSGLLRETALAVIARGQGRQPPGN